MRNLIPRQGLLLKRIRLVLNLHKLNYRKQIELKLIVGFRLGFRRIPITSRLKVINLYS